MFTLAGIALTQTQKDSMTTSGTPTAPAGEVPGAKKEIAVVETSMGTFEIELYPQDAPKTVENFVGLAGKKYFDGCRVHRVVPGFVIQMGDDKSKDTALRAQWGTGGHSLWGKAFADELNPSTKSYQEGYKKGVVAMANAGPNTNTSQFFVCTANVGLPHSYTIFGKVVSGMDVIDKIGSVQRNPQDQPLVDVVVKKIHLKK
jgi:cyclophilin family peptidyl-prolyl cis-trans isomerase